MDKDLGQIVEETEEEVDLTTEEDTANSDSAEEVEAATAEAADTETQDDQAEFEIVLDGEEPDSQDDKQKLIPVSPRELFKLREASREAKRSSSEAEELRAELDELKKQVAAPQQVQQPVTQAAPVGKVPERYDFDTEEEYSQAHAKWVSDLLAQNQQQAQANQQIDAIKQRIDQSVGEHFQRAESLLNEHRIDLERYQANEGAVRGRLGDDVFEALVDAVGEGSEKVAFYLGDPKNAAKLDELEELLRFGDHGSRAIAYATRLSERLKPKAKDKQVSQAPPADGGLPGGNNKDASLAALKKELDQLSKGRDRTKMLERKRELIAAGQSDSLRKLGYLH